MRKGEHVVGDAAIAARNRNRLTSKGLRQPKRIGDAITLFLGQLESAFGLDMECRPGRMQAVREALGVTDKPRRAWVLAHADQKPLARCPRPGDGTRLHLVKQLLVHALGGATQGQLAKSREVGRGEEMLKGPDGLLGNVDLAFPEALDQVVRGNVDEFNRVRAVKDRVRARSRGRGRQ